MAATADMSYLVGVKFEKTDGHKSAFFDYGPYNLSAPDYTATQRMWSQQVASMGGAAAA